MNEKRLFETLLGLVEPWSVERVELHQADEEVHVWVALPKRTRWVCPECLDEAPIHDHQERKWRHLDTCQFRTLIHARVPRLSCPTHGVRQIEVPWAEKGSRFTALFEALAIDWMKEASIVAVAKQMRLSWDEAAGIQERAVRRGLARREKEMPEHIGIDETSFQRRHEYVTVVNDLGVKPRVLFVADDRKRESLDGYWESLTSEQRAGIKAVAMDMWEPYIQSTRTHLPNADQKIVFDKFHVAMHLNQAVDQVRREEHRRLLAEGKGWLKGTKYDWLRHPASFAREAWVSFRRLKEKAATVARAWAIKEAAMVLWDLHYMGAADRNFREWFKWARRSALEPIKKVALLIQRHWPNIRTFFDHRTTNAGSEAMNAKIQRVKSMARGFRSRVRFRMAIYFHCGGLDLYPAGIRP